MRAGSGFFSLANGNAAFPAYSWNSSAAGNDANTGFYRFGEDTIGISTGGAHSLRISGGATATIAGGAGNMTLLGGTGASRTLTLQTTTSGSAAKNTLVLGADSSATFLGQIKSALSNNTTLLATTSAATTGYVQLTDFSNTSGRFVAGLEGSVGGTVTTGSTAYAALLGNINNVPVELFANNTVRVSVSATSTTINNRTIVTGDTIRSTSKVRFTGLTAASGSPNSVCQDATTKELLENAASSCVVSSLRYKENIRPLTLVTASKIVAQLRPVTYNYKRRGRMAIGLIAEQVDTVDTRLVSRDGQGRANSVNYEQVTIALLTVVQQQQLVLDSLRRGKPATAGGNFGVLAGAIVLGGVAAGAAIARRKVA